MKKRTLSTASLAKLGNQSTWKSNITPKTVVVGVFAEEVKEIDSFVKYTPSLTPVEGKGIGVQRRAEENQKKRD